jgi:hypothetical protein
MTAFDDDPEYEAQLRDVLGDETSPWPDIGQQEEMGELVKDTDDQSEDDVLNDAPTFRMKLPHGESKGTRRITKDDDEISITDIKDGKAMSEDARSISTGDDSPSVQVFKSNKRLLIQGV